MNDEDLASKSAVKIERASGNLIQAGDKIYVLTASHVVKRANEIAPYPDTGTSRAFPRNDGFYTVVADPEGGVAVARYVASIHNTGSFLEEGGTIRDLAILEIVDASHPAVEEIRNILANDDNPISIFGHENSTPPIQDIPNDYGLNRKPVVLPDNLSALIPPESGNYGLSGFPAHAKGERLSIHSAYEFAMDKYNKRIFVAHEGSPAMFVNGSSGSVSFTHGIPLAVHVRDDGNNLRPEKKCDSIGSPAGPALFLMQHTIPILNAAGYEMSMVQRISDSTPLRETEWQFNLIDASGHVLSRQEADQVINDLGLSRNPVDLHTATPETLAKSRYNVCDVDTQTPPKLVNNVPKEASPDRGIEN